jgi:Tol biopolymer transport system component
MTLTIGTRLGPYEVIALVGAGGMGEVYKARDTRLNRFVAVKLLHPDLAERLDKRTRFDAEARAISALGHPHICALFDIGNADGRRYLVMEYLEGETLDDRLTRGPLGMGDLLRHAVEIADALEHAHARQIVHRDLKPSNVMLTASGAKLLDFGLAQQPAPDRAGPLSTASFAGPTLTAEGVMIGTFQYMAPEQLEGKRADPRTDVFAFGALLYEMATARRAFVGQSQASLIASILTEQPPAIGATRSARREEPLFALDHVVRRCLAKTPDERWQTARDLKLELEWIAAAAGAGLQRPRPSRAFRAREALAWALAIGASAAAAFALATRHDAPHEPIRFVVAPPPGTTIGVAENRTRMAVSPDGRRLAILAFSDGTPRIWVRSLDSVDAAAVPGTAGAQSPFWSPDGRFIGFFSPGEGALKKVEFPGGPLRTICAAQSDGAAVWGPDGTILFTQFLDGIYRVPAAGGTPSRVTHVDRARHELNHYWPEFLPDGRHFLYLATSLAPDGSRATPGVYVASLDSSVTTLVARMHSRVRFAAPGHLLFTQDGALLAQPFDLSTLRLSGDPRQIADGIGYVRTLGNGAFAVSTSGVLAYQGAGEEAEVRMYDRRGTARDIGWAKQQYGQLRFSRNGQRIAADVVDPTTGTADIWIYDAARGAPVRLTADPEDQSGPVWSGDGGRLLYRSSRGGPESLRLRSAAPNLFVRTISSGLDQLLVSDPSPLQTEDWSWDGKWIVYTRNTRQTGTDIWLMPAAAGATPQPFSNERFEEYAAAFSPDARWIAFVSNESGVSEVYVAPLDRRGERTRISNGGGTTPRWRRDGHELFYVSADHRAIMSVAIDSAHALSAGPPSRLFTIDPAPVTRSPRRTAVYDVSPDGERFLVSVPAGQAMSSRITVVLDWPGMLAR